MEQHHHTLIPSFGHGFDVGDESFSEDTSTQLLNELEMYAYADRSAEQQTIASDSVAEELDYLVKAKEEHELLTPFDLRLSSMYGIERRIREDPISYRPAKCFPRLREEKNIDLACAPPSLSPFLFPNIIHVEEGTTFQVTPLQDSSTEINFTDAEPNIEHVDIGQEEDDQSEDIEMHDSNIDANICYFPAAHDQIFIGPLAAYQSSSENFSELDYMLAGQTALMYPDPEEEPPMTVRPGEYFDHEFAKIACTHSWYHTENLPGYVPHHSRLPHHSPHGPGASCSQGRKPGSKCKICQNETFAVEETVLLDDDSASPSSYDSMSSSDITSSSGSSTITLSDAGFMDTITQDDEADMIDETMLTGHAGYPTPDSEAEVNPLEEEKDDEVVWLGSFERLEPNVPAGFLPIEDGDLQANSLMYFFTYADEFPTEKAKLDFLKQIHGSQPSIM